MESQNEKWEQFKKLLQPDFICPDHKYEYTVVCHNKNCLATKGKNIFMCMKCLINQHEQHKDHFNCVQLLDEIMPQQFYKQSNRSNDLNSFKIKSKSQKINVNFELGCQNILNSMQQKISKLDYTAQIEQFSNSNGINQKEQLIQFTCNVIQDWVNEDQYHEEILKIKAQLDKYFDKIENNIKKYQEIDKLNKEKLKLPTVVEFEKMSESEKNLTYKNLYNVYGCKCNEFQNKRKSKKGNKNPIMDLQNSYIQQ